MCDQSVSLEKGVNRALSRDALTFSIHLYKNIVKHTDKGTYIPFFEMMNTLDTKVRIDANNKLLGKFSDSAISNKIATYLKVSDNQNLFCRSLRRDDFDLFTTNAVEQFHSFLTKIRKGNLINLLSQTLTLQANASNKLNLENTLMAEQLTPFGEVMLSFNIALALLFKVTQEGLHFKCEYDTFKGVNLENLFKDYMQSVHRNIKSYLKSRASYLVSLQSCSADVVTENSCSLCNATNFYTYCPHIIAVRLKLFYPEILDLTTFQAFGKKVNFAQLLWKTLQPAEVVNLFGCLPAMYYGYFNTSDNTKTSFNDNIYHPTVINTWVAQVSNYLNRETDSARNIQIMNSLVGRPKDFFETMRRFYTSTQGS